MNNFIFENSTKVYFGKGCVKEFLAGIMDGYGENVMLAYGVGSTQNGTGIGETEFTRDTAIRDVIDYPGFGSYGRLIFPVNNGYYSGDTLGSLSLTWYNDIQPDKTVEIANYMKEHADAGDVIFYDIYTDEEKAADPEKKIPDCFSLRVIQAESLPYATRAEVLLMSEQCRTVSLTRWSCRRRDTTRLR